MTSRFFMRVCLLAVVVPLTASGIAAARAQAPTAAPASAAIGNVTVVTIVDVTPDYARPDNVAHSVELLHKLRSDTQKAPGLVSFTVLRDPSRDNHFLITSVWKDVKFFDLYTGAETTRAFRSAFQPGEAGPFDERIYVDLK